jgi:hypothetical protein
VPVPPARPGKPGQAARPGQAPIESETDALVRAKREKEQLGLEVKEAEEELERVKARYDQYFIGFERREPKRERDEIRKRVMLLKDAFTRNAALKFRIQALHARYLSYERLWVRSAREKEEGTYRRDIFKARLRAKDAKEAREAAQGAAGVHPAPSSPAANTPAAGPAGPPASASQAARPGAAPPASPAAKVPPVPATPAAAPDPRMRALYDAYITAKKQCGEDVSRISFDAVSRSVSKQIPELMARYKAKSVDFRVEVKEGRAVLKAIPKV